MTPKEHLWAWIRAIEFRRANLNAAAEATNKYWKKIAY